MKAKTLIYFILLLFRALIAHAQITENFSDGDIATNPQWLGIASDWKVNATLQLQSDNTVANSTYYLSTSSTLATAAQWEFFVNLLFNTSAANYADVFLTASASDLTAAATTGPLRHPLPSAHLVDTSYKL